MGKKILLADDSITIQKVIELTFSDEDFEVVTVGNGRLAIERVLDVRPDIVLCDIIMPEKDGYEVCDFIKKSPVLAHVPVLLLTGAFEPFDQERAARVGCDGFLAKPFEPQTLIAKVKELLSQAGGRPVAPPARPVAVPSAAAPPPVETAPPEPAPFFAPAEPEGPAEAEVSFIPDEPFLDYTEAPSGQVAPPAATAEPSAEAELEHDLYGVVDAVDAPPDELLTVTPEESASLGASPAADPAATLMFKSGSQAPWQTTMEVPLEARARAGVESIQRDSDAGIFEEVFVDDTLNLKGPVITEEPPAADLEADLEPASPGAEAAASEPEWEPMAELDTGLEAPAEPSPAAAVEAEPIGAAMSSEAPAFEPEPVAVPEPRPAATPFPSPAPATVSAPFSTPAPVAAAPEPEPSFADVGVAEAEPAPAAPSAAAEASVPVDMVAQIAQRVVAQISEKVVREIAWEVIPDLAEALIKKEIERLKAELQHT